MKKIIVLLSVTFLSGLVSVNAYACVKPVDTYSEFGDELGAELRKAEKRAKNTIESRSDLTDEDKSELDDYFSDAQDDWASYAQSHCLASVLFHKGAEDEALEQACLSTMAQQRLEYLKSLYKDKK